MKRKNIVKAHLIATIIAALTILTFFSTSLFAEIKGDEALIKSVKAFILYALPIMIIAMPALKIAVLCPVDHRSSDLPYLVRHPTARHC